MFSPCHSHSVILPESTVCVCSDCVAIATWLSGYCSICHGVKKKKKSYYYRHTGLKHISPESMKEQHIQSEVSVYCNLH